MVSLILLFIYFFISFSCNSSFDLRIKSSLLFTNDTIVYLFNFYQCICFLLFLRVNFILYLFELYFSLPLVYP